MSCFGVWPCRRHYWTLSYSQETHTCRVSHQCETGGGSSDSQGENKPLSSLQTERNKMRLWKLLLRISDFRKHYSEFLSLAMEISKFFQQKSNFHQTKNSFFTCKKKTNTKPLDKGKMKFLKKKRWDFTKKLFWTRHTVHLCGFSPVCRLIWTTNIYWALKGFSSRLHSFHRQINIFLLACIWSMLICYNTKNKVKHL